MPDSPQPPATPAPPATPPATRAAPCAPAASGGRGARTAGPVPVRRRGRRPGAAGPEGRRPRPLGAMDRNVLFLYLVTRAGVWTTAYCSGRLFTGDGGAHRAPSMLSRWQQWDWAYYLHIARDGYFAEPGAGGAATVDNREAFLPGFPMLLRAVHGLLLPDWTAAGLLISFVAGAVAVLALARIAESELPGGRGGSHAVFYLLLSPCAVFLAAGYTEALFLALALPSWLAARKGRWPLAAVLACAAGTVRVNGLFLAAALLVQFLTTVRERRGSGWWRRVPWPAAAPVLPFALYSWWLHSRTGDWMAWKHAEERGWYRQFHSPWQAWGHTWTAAFSHTQTTPYALLFQAELAAMVAGAGLLCVLLRLRRWPEAVYLALTLWALGTSYWYMSVPRSSLLWWPLWVLLARWGLRRPWLRSAYVAVVAPLTTVLTLAFTSGRWAG